MFNGICTLRKETSFKLVIKAIISVELVINIVTLTNERYYGLDVLSLVI